MMLSINFIFLIKLLLISVSMESHCHIPNTAISNGIITANLYLPDKESGFYRSTRFDWAGVIYELEYKGHSYFGQWFDKYDPKKHDAICGPVDEFGAVGYDSAKVGNSFLKIGVGMLRKPSSDPYSSFIYYEIENTGKRSIHKTNNKIEFKHILTDQSGYAYEYIKIVKLIEGKPELLVNHYIRNKGTKRIKTTVYNHNFFMIDYQKIGPDLTIRFPFELNGYGLGIGELARLSKKEIKFLKPLEKEDRVFISDLKGFGKHMSDHSFSIENQQTGAGVKLKGDKPLEHIVFWSCSTTSCPEPYIKINLAPTEEFSWENSYEFYTF